MIYAKCSPSEPNDELHIIYTIYKNKFNFKVKADVIISQLIN